MNAAEWVNGARRSAGLTQRQLSEGSGIPQPTIARIESGKQMPRADTLDRLLRACGWELDMTLRRGQGVDRREIDRFLELTPAERLERAAAVAHLARAYGIPDEGQTIGAVLKLALEDTASHADE